ncbi:hypothetical protein PQX77_009864, partial [Marasmius sp. AFHP31]
MSHSHNGAQPEAYSNVEPYYSEYNRMLRIPASPPSTKEKMKWAESHMESLSLAKAQNSPRISRPNPVPNPKNELQGDFDMQVDQETADPFTSDFSPPEVAGSGMALFANGTTASGEQSNGPDTDAMMEVDAMDDGESGGGRKRKADGEVDDAPACKRQSPNISRAN